MKNFKIIDKSTNDGFKVEFTADSGTYIFSLNGFDSYHIVDNSVFVGNCQIDYWYEKQPIRAFQILNKNAFFVETDTLFIYVNSTKKDLKIVDTSDGTEYIIFYGQ